MTLLKKPDAILLDLDDTITCFDSVCEPAWTKICNDYTARYPLGITGAALYDLIQSAGKKYWSDPERHKRGREDLRNARREVVALALKSLDVAKEERAREIADNYTDLHDSMIAPLPGAVEALKLLTSMDIRLAVVTNGASAGQRNKLNRFDLTRFFEHIFVDTEVGYSKPDARIFQHALDTLSVKPEKTWMVGDNLVWDVFGAQQLGIFSVWNDYRGKGLPSDAVIFPDLIVNSIYEMSKIIGELK